MQLYVKISFLVIQQDDPTSWARQPLCHFPLLGRLLCASWRNTRFVWLEVFGPGWFLRAVEAMSALTSPVLTLQMRMRKGSKCQADARRREQQKQRREAWKVKGSSFLKPGLVVAKQQQRQQLLQQQHATVVTAATTAQAAYQAAITSLAAAKLTAHAAATTATPAEQQLQQHHLSKWQLQQ